MTSKPIALILALVFAAPLAPDAQQARVYRVGVIVQGGPYLGAVDGLRKGLAELGLEEGKQFILHVRDGKGDLKAVEQAAGDLEREKVDLIYSLGTRVTLVVKRATKTAWGRRRQYAPSLARRDNGRPPAAPELVIVDVVTQHDEEPHEELAGHGDFRLGAPAPLRQGAIRAGELRIEARGMGGGLAEDKPEERTALLGNLAEPVLVGRGPEGGGQADIADDVLAVGKAADCPQHYDGGEGGHGTNARVGQ